MLVPLLLCAVGALTSGAAPGAEATPAPSDGQVAAAPPAEPSPTAPRPGWRGGLEGVAGWGYYERFHVALALASPVATLGVLGGTNLGAGGATIWSTGLFYSHALHQPVGIFEGGFDAKALYWTRSDPDYDWKLLTLIAGGYLAKELQPALSLVLDAGLAYTLTIDTVRKQNVNFAYPTRWNASVCVELRYRFESW